MGKYSQTIEARHQGDAEEEMALIKISKTAQKTRFVTAISWSKAATDPAKVFYDEQSGKIIVEEKELDLTFGHEGFGNKSQFEWE
jgi:inosine/xanthosine triphosphate pyrophosphatase family protein